jgi:hypothetical protein
LLVSVCNRLEYAQCSRYIFVNWFWIIITNAWIRLFEIYVNSDGFDIV